MLKKWVKYIQTNYSTTFWSVLSSCFTKNPLIRFSIFLREFSWNLGSHIWSDRSKVNLQVIKKVPGYSIFHLQEISIYWMQSELLWQKTRSHLGWVFINEFQDFFGFFFEEFFGKVWIAQKPKKHPKETQLYLLYLLYSHTPVEHRPSAFSLHRWRFLAWARSSPKDFPHGVISHWSRIFNQSHQVQQKKSRGMSAMPRCPRTTRQTQQHQCQIEPQPRRRNRRFVSQHGTWERCIKRED